MLSITQFTIHKHALALDVTLTSDDASIENTWHFSFEYLRVAGLDSNTKLVSNKKLVELVRIEAVAKHGYRFCFDDGFEVIYNQHELAQLHQHHDTIWQTYLDALAEQKLSREANIDIKQL
ncbi:hypothetical protein ACFSJY_13335 [Thalassotalea euphylliae]|uniref:hypothetical protein n=1 Tax=Thalassotalea euphylliae TaxID=1655234 RepID=UPI00363F15E0